MNINAQKEQANAAYVLNDNIYPILRNLFRIKQEAGHDGDVDRREQVYRLSVDRHGQHVRVCPADKIGGGKAQGHHGDHGDAYSLVYLIDKHNTLWYI